ncbi:MULTISPECIES: lipoprotein NlpI [Aliagarivorans]|uniref:lipoprotein NlpI n=1 Tax=Aliagarivorans TaxID=882379 RepID=UPI000422E977|nr:MULTISPECIES: lipoprotein NlpI [Aliagarivorans]
MYQLPFKGLFIALVMLGLAGCTLTGQEESPPVVLATPLQVNQQSEVALARLGQMLNSGEYDQEETAQLYYERALVFDRVGLRSLARLDFNRALQLKPDFAEVYNFLGVYFILQEDFESAFESFDSAIELYPDYGFAYFYRSVALSYAMKPQLALTDIDTYAEQDLGDPYRVLWRYLIHRDVDDAAALEQLQSSLRAFQTDDWGWQIVAMYAGELTQTEFLELAAMMGGDNRQLAERLCEAYFYLAKQAQRAQQYDLAASYFKLSLANNVFDFVEHRLALLELYRYEQNLLENAG